jgi:Ca2+-transporting ATPase
LLIAAIVSIGLGFYEDYGTDHPPKTKVDRNFNKFTAPDPKISWVEGVAILVAVLIVVLVGSLNDYQKEAQFRKLNAKKEDREVKVWMTNASSFLHPVMQSI